MKYKLTIVIILIILLVGGGIYESFCVKNTLNNFSNLLNQLHEQDKMTAEEIQFVSDWWDKEHPKLSITISHVLLNEIGITLQELKGAVEAEDDQSANALLLRIISYSENLMDLYKFEFINVI